MTDDGERRPSGEAQNSAGQPRENASDPGPSDAPKKPGCLIRFLASVLVGAGIIGLFWAVASELEFFAGGSEASDASATESTVTDQGAVSTEPTSGADGSAGDAEGPISDTAGPISGTWAMYWKNSEGSETQAFAITFTGSDTGTLEIHEDGTESETAFEVDGDQVQFKFTRTFEVPSGDWPEGSTFKGTLTGRNEILGKWARQGWECSPDTGGKHTAEWSRHESRLIRTSE